MLCNALWIFLYSLRGCETVWKILLTPTVWHCGTRVFTLGLAMFICHSPLGSQKWKCPWKKLYVEKHPCWEKETNLGKDQFILMVTGFYVKEKRFVKETILSREWPTSFWTQFFLHFVGYICSVSTFLAPFPHQWNF